MFSTSPNHRVRRMLLRLGVVGLLSLACHMAPEGEPDEEGDTARATIGDVQWYVDYDAAVEIAREQDKALWVHFGENPG